LAKLAKLAFSKKCFAESAVIYDLLLQRMSFFRIWVKDKKSRRWHFFVVAGRCYRFWHAFCEKM